MYPENESTWPLNSNQSVSRLIEQDKGGREETGREGSYSKGNTRTRITHEELELYLCMARFFSKR